MFIEPAWLWGMIVCYDYRIWLLVRCTLWSLMIIWLGLRNPRTLWSTHLIYVPLWFELLIIYTFSEPVWFQNDRPVSFFLIVCYDYCIWLLVRCSLWSYMIIWQLLINQFGFSIIQGPFGLLTSFMFLYGSRLGASQFPCSSVVFYDPGVVQIHNPFPSFRSFYD